MGVVKDRSYYLSKLSVGNIVAFNVNNFMFSGKVTEIFEPGNEYRCSVRTKNNSVYFLVEKDIVWIKNGTHWPLGVYNALKASKERKE